VRITKKKKPIKLLPSAGGNLYPEGIEAWLPEIEPRKEENKDGNASAKKHHDSIRHGRDAGEGLSSYAR
jgi:hypothetical protein